MLALHTPLAFMSSFKCLFLVYYMVEKLMHQLPNPINFFFQREMARIEKMELLEKVRDKRLERKEFCCGY